MVGVLRNEEAEEFGLLGRVFPEFRFPHNVSSKEESR